MQCITASAPVNPTVLVVDDTEANIDMLVDILGDGYDIVVALDGPSALDVALEFPPDLILLDIMMPEMDGYEVCRRLKAQEATSKIPIIFITALNEEADETKGLALGAVDYIVKPLKPAIVRARVRTHLDLKRKTDQLEKLVCIDGLTGISNRRGLDEFVAREWKHAARNQLMLSFILMDIDFFKKFNDLYGHAAGDECLRKVAMTLAACLKRPVDYVARYGGEEFAAILPNTDAAGALCVAEMMREQICALGIKHAASEVSNHVTLSLGVATMTPQADQPMLCLIEAADAALYIAKSTGRNRVQAHL